MEKYIRYSVIITIVIFALLAVWSVLSDALVILKQTNLFLFTLASIFFILSIVFWIIPWVYLLKKKSNFSLWKSIILGYSCVYGALTPIQIGTEALRSMKAKKFFKVSYSESVSAAMIVKGIKFFILVIIASGVLLYLLLTTPLSAIMFFALTTGFGVIILAMLLFLLPLNKSFGLKISKLFGKLSKKISKFSIVEKYFFDYSHYLKKIKKEKFFLALILSVISFIFEFLALYFAFLSLNVFIELSALAFLFIIIAILERTPFLPRGVGLVEAVGFIFLSIPNISSVTLAVAQISAILILFDVVRLIIPTITSLAIASIPLEKLSQ
jgi:uncharacterized protein (TIRG00374 family)